MLTRHLYAVAAALSIITIPYYVFWRYAHFTEVQAMVLAVMAAALISLFVMAAKKPPRFEPFYIRIAPQWHDILCDQGLIDDETWKSLNSADPAGEQDAYSVLRDGITVTVLGPELYYSHDHRRFFSELDLRESISELLAPAEWENVSSFAPRLYAKLTIEDRPKKSHTSSALGGWLKDRFGESGKIRCIQFGLVTADSMERIGFHPDLDRASIPLATLPYAIFNDYNHGYFALDGKLKRPEIERLLKEYGWECCEPDDDYGRRDWPYEINHKYVRVSYKGV